MAKKKKERSSAPKLGVTYQAAKLGLQVGGPFAYQAYTDPSQAGFEFRLRSRNYQKGVAVSLIDQWGSKKLGHAQALSRKSITALAPEVLAGLDAAHRGDLDPVNSGAAFIQNTSGYDPIPDSFSTDSVKSYLVQKYGLGVARKVVNKTRLAEPFKRALSMMGVSL